MLKWYVMNWDWNKHEIVEFNIFNNWVLEEAVIKEIKKYLRSPGKYSKTNYLTKETIYGFDAFCKELDSLIKWEEWSRCEYEILVGDAFTLELKDIVRKADKWLEKDSNALLSEFNEMLHNEQKKTYPFKIIDCYKQCKRNIPMIAREVIWQYKQSLKGE